MMDEMKLKLSTRIMRGIVAKLIARGISRKFDADVDIKLTEIEIATVGDKVYFHVNGDGEMSKEDFVKIIKSMGL